MKALLETGLSDYEVGRRLGIPRATVLNWRKRECPPRPQDTAYLSGRWRPADPRAYTHLLGLYLGDGCIVVPRRGAPRLIVVLDRRYPAMIEEAAIAFRAVMPEGRLLRHPRPGAVALVMTHPGWIQAFPQHGPGKKHQREIELAAWQRNLTRRWPRSLLRGLIHSDGCRVVNRFKTALPSGRVVRYSYVRYFFTNYSADIRAIFCEHCDLLGVRWTQSSFKNISIANRASVAILDSFVGPKG